MLTHTQKQINYFRSQSEANFIFACQVAVPLVLTPDLLYQIWNNFKQYTYTFDTPQKLYKIPHIAVSDFLLSSLCKEVGFELYEMEKEMRAYLLKDLVDYLGEKRKNTIAAFLLEYAQREFPYTHRQNLRNLHELTAQSILNPVEMEKLIVENIKKTNNPNERMRQLLLHHTLVPQGYKSKLTEISQVAAQTRKGQEIQPILIQEHLQGEGVFQIKLPQQLSQHLQVKRKADIIIQRNLETKEKELNLGYCGIKNLDNFPKLFECTHLEELILSNAYWEYDRAIRDYAGIYAEKDDKENHISVLPPQLAQLTHLRKFICGGFDKKNWDLSDVSVLSQLPHLEYLNLNNSQISDLSFLKGMTQLRTLIMGENQIQDISPISNLRQLEVLELHNNQIQDISPLSNLTQLKELALSNNQIHDISPLENLQSLTFVDIHSNQVDDLFPLYPLIKKGIKVSNTSWNRYVINVENNPLKFPNLELINYKDNKLIIHYFETEYIEYFLQKREYIKIVELLSKTTTPENLYEKGMISEMKERINLFHKEYNKTSDEPNIWEVRNLIQAFEIIIEKRSPIDKKEQKLVQLFNKISNDDIVKLLTILEFNENDLDEFCSNYFEDVYLGFNPQSTKSQKVIALIEYCIKHLQISQLMQRIKNDRYDSYQKYIAPIMLLIDFLNTDEIYKQLINVINSQNPIKLDENENDKVNKSLNPQQIIDLEKKIGVKLKEADSMNTIMHQSGRNHYLLNENRELIGLNLHDCTNYFELSVLAEFSSIKALKLSHLIGINNHTNKIDISPLARLQNLTALDLGSNKIIDITPLQYLINLTTLKLSYNKIEDITPLKDLIKLEELYLTKNQIEDINVLKHLPNLTKLGIANNKISDILVLGSLKNLIRLELNGNPIKDGNITILGEITTNLQELFLGFNNIKDISCLQEAVNLHILYLDNNDIQDINPLNKLINLIKLNITDNRINDLSPLSNLTKLNTLLFNNNHVSNIYTLKALIEKGLKINGLNNPLTIPPIEVIEQGNQAILDWFEVNNIEPIYAIESHLNITLSQVSLEKYNENSNTYALNTEGELIALSLKGNHFTDLSFLDILKNTKSIEVLDLSYNQIIELPEWIGELTTLKTLKVRKNRLASLPDSIGNLVNLITLELGQNTLTKVNQEIGKLTNLQLLVLENNPIEHLGEVFTNLKSLKQLYIANTYKLTTIPESIGNCTQLEGFYIDNNKISTLPSSLQNCKQLSRICLHNNAFRELPTWLFDFPNIHYIDYQTNSIWESNKNTMYLAGIPFLEDIPKYIFNNIDIKAAFKNYLEQKNHIASIEDLQKEIIHPKLDKRENSKTNKWLQHFNMILIKRGTFKKGAIPEKKETIKNDFYIAKHPLTQELWTEVMGYNPSYFQDKQNLPIENISWLDAQKFIATLNDLTDLSFRLPTEAEWEYAAKGGNKSRKYKYAGSNNIDEVAWYSQNSNNQTHPVGMKKPNELGLYDMSGNVWEFSQNLYEKDERVICGGSWFAGENYCEPSFRLPLKPSDISNVYGLRLCITIKPKEILSIEQKLNIELEEVLFNNTISREDNNYFSLNNYGQIIGLNLRKNQLTDISFLSNLIDLQILDISDNNISDISPLKNLIQLQKLILNKNLISDISPLRNLTKLQDLWFIDNQVSDISPLSNLTELESLYFNENQVSDLSPLSNLTKLNILFFDNNQISDIYPLKTLIEKGLKISGLNNPLINPPIEVAEESTQAILEYLEAQGNKVPQVSKKRDELNYNGTIQIKIKGIDKICSIELELEENFESERQMGNENKYLGIIPYEDHDIFIYFHEYPILVSNHVEFENAEDETLLENSKDNLLSQFQEWLQEGAIWDETMSPQETLTYLKNYPKNKYIENIKILLEGFYNLDNLIDLGEIFNEIYGELSINIDILDIDDVEDAKIDDIYYNAELDIIMIKGNGYVNLSWQPGGENLGSSLNYKFPLTYNLEIDFKDGLWKTDEYNSIYKVDTSPFWSDDFEDFK